MLPFGFKIAWFCLSLTGLLSCWVTLFSFGRIVGAYWPLVYCIGCTLLQGAFCLGIIYRMQPSNMPNSFCIAQSVIIGFGTFLMTGVAAAFSIATTLAVLKPKTWGDNGKAALIWRPVYFVPVVAFPIFASAVQIGVTVKYHRTFSASDDMHCDYVNPMWIRFLSYAGTPFFLSIPCLYLSIKSIIRVYKTNKHLKRSRNPDMEIDHFTALPRRPNDVHIPRVLSTPSPSPDFSPTARREPLSPALASPALASRKFHMPFSTPTLQLNNLNSSTNSSRDTDEPDSPVSSSFPTFVNPPQGGTVSIDPDGISEVHPQPREDWREILAAHSNSMDMDKRSSLKWNEDGKSDFDYNMKGGDDDDDIITEDSATCAPRTMPSIGSKFLVYRHTPFPQNSIQSAITRKSRRQPPPTLGPAVWRIIVFQLAFTIVQALACISTLVDVIKNRSPSPFGTQHVALLLSAWGPVIIFGP
ncbi:hypothetical protein BDZ94DRAFT_1202533 [Collybia nuda]|uniref:Uncharacterized protein n=1 Tax=Collybia nuda TaxID=64659 RepID=A0A9P5XXM2_9AGAR|nr:hypothetical protein BDZ94DRAFT_1202533 [Collybia nuda]